jgi:hypothetical protein
VTLLVKTKCHIIEHGHFATPVRHLKLFFRRQGRFTRFEVKRAKTLGVLLQGFI